MAVPKRYLRTNQIEENADRIIGKMGTRAATKAVRSALGTRGALGNLTNASKIDVQVANKKDVCKGKRLNVKSAVAALQTAVVLTEQVSKPVVMSPEPMDMGQLSMALESFSQNLLDGVEDIDKNDGENPQLCREYVDDIYKYIRKLERQFKVHSDYMANQEITERMRSILIDWLVQVHLRFKLLQETLFMTIQLLDRYLEVRSVGKDRLQLVGVTAMLIAAKYEETYPPEIGDFAYITDNAYSTAQIRAMERTILMQLSFNLGKPLCIHFLRRNSKAGGADGPKHTLAKYLMELTLTDYTFVKYDPSEIAAAALCLSNTIMDGHICEWTQTLAHYSTYTEEHIRPIVQEMVDLLGKLSSSRFQAIRTKYATSKFLRISASAELKSFMANLACSQEH